MSVCAQYVFIPHPLPTRQSVQCTSSFWPPCLPATSVCVEYIFIPPPLSATSICIVYVFNVNQCRVCLHVSLCIVRIYSAPPPFPSSQFVRCTSSTWPPISVCHVILYRVHLHSGVQVYLNLWRLTVCAKLTDMSQVRRANYPLLLALFVFLILFKILLFCTLLQHKHHRYSCV